MIHRPIGIFQQGLGMCTGLLFLGQCPPFSFSPIVGLVGVTASFFSLTGLDNNVTILGTLYATSSVEPTVSGAPAQTPILASAPSKFAVLWCHLRLWCLALG